jgi:tetratricopeptide (TPR) repeat protein
MVMGRDLQKVGRPLDAARILQRLAAFRDLPVGLAEETHARLATIFLDSGEYQQARRHLTSAIFYRPSHAVYYYQLARALQLDLEADASRAVRYYRRAVQLDPDQPTWWVDFGFLLMQIGKAQKGVTALRKAASLAPDDAATLGRVVEGLCLAGRCKEARSLLKSARFRNPRSEPFRRLWNELQFRLAAESQMAGPAIEEPVILPFVRRASLPEAPSMPGRIVRLDRSSKPSPHLGRRSRIPDSKNAQ